MNFVSGDAFTDLGCEFLRKAAGLLLKKKKKACGRSTYTFFKSRYFLWQECICFSNDGNQVGNFSQCFHSLDIERREGVTRGLHKVKNGVNADVVIVSGDVPFRFEFVVEVVTVLRVYKSGDGFPSSRIVDKVAKAGRINDCQARLEAFFF